MRRSVAICLAMLLLATAAIAADRSALVMHYLLTRAGYQEAGITPMRPGTWARAYVGTGALAGYELDSQGRLVSTAVIIVNPRDLSAYQAIGAGYVAVQERLGKARNLLDASPEVIANKGRYLMDAIRHNLRLHDRTTFPYDDMQVTAAKNEADRTVIIILSPRW